MTPDHDQHTKEYGPEESGPRQLEELEHDLELDPICMLCGHNMLRHGVGACIVQGCFCAEFRFTPYLHETLFVVLLKLIRKVFRR